MVHVIKDCGLSGEENMQKRLAIYPEFLKKEHVICEFIELIPKLGITDSKELLAIVLEILKHCKEYEVGILIRNFPKGEWQTDHLLLVAREICKTGEEDHTIELLKHFDKLGLKKATHDERMTLLKEILSELDDLYLAEDFDKFGIIEDINAHTNDAEKIAYCIELMKQGNWIARGLAKHFDLLRLTANKDRCVIFSAIAETGFLSAYELSYHFDKLGFLEDIQQITDLSERIALCKTIAQKGAWAATGLSRFFDKLGLENVSTQERLALCNTLAMPNTAGRKWGKNTLSDSFKKLGFIKDILALDSASKRIAFCIELANSGGEWAKNGLANNFELLGLENATMDERCSLCTTIAQSLDAESALEDRFDKLGFGQDIQRLNNPAQRLAACHKVAMLGEWAAKSIVVRYDKLVPKDVSNPERLAFCHAIVNQGVETAATLAKNFQKLGLSQTTDQERLHLCKAIVSQGGDAASALMSDPEKLHFSDESILTLSLYYASQGHHRYFLAVVFSSSKHFSDRLKQRVCSALMTRHTILSERDELVSLIKDRLPPTEMVPFEAFMSDHPVLHCLKPMIEDIKEKDPFVQQALMQWASFAASILLPLTAMQAAVVLRSGLLTDIYKHQVQANRFEFMQELGTMLEKDPETLLKAIQPTDKRWKRLSVVPIYHLRELGLNKALCDELLTRIGKLDFRDTKRFNTLLQFLFEVIKQGPYKEEELTSIAGMMREILSTKAESKHAGIVEISNKFQVYTDILQIFGKEALLSTFKAKSAPQLFFLERFKSLFKVNDEVNFKENYQNTFARFNPPSSLYTYLRAVNRLPDEDRERVHRVLNDYVNAVLDGKFREVRYDIKLNRHLEIVFGLRKNFKDKEMWMDNQKPKSFGKYTIYESDDPSELINIGNIKGSCQRLDGKPQHNKALPGYLMNGDVKAIIVNEGDKVDARGIMRLMCADKNNVPVILIEPTYSNVEDEEINQAINRWAVEKATTMKLSLVYRGKPRDDDKVTNNKAGTPYQGAVKFLGGYAPYVDCDSYSVGPIAGPFDVEGARVL